MFKHQRNPFFQLHIVTAGTVGQRFLLIKNVGKIKNVKNAFLF